MAIDMEPHVGNNGTVVHRLTANGRKGGRKVGRRKGEGGKGEE
jgi:hypothetical protein